MEQSEGIVLLFLAVPCFFVANVSGMSETWTS